MTHHNTFQIAQSAIRAKICTRCYQRPQGSDTLLPSVPRACEGKCPIFMNLDKLLKIDASVDDAGLSPYEDAMVGIVCSECKANPTAGEYCSERMARTCPLSRYLRDVIEILDTVMKLHRSKV